MNMRTEQNQSRSNFKNPKNDSEQKWINLIIWWSNEKKE